MRHLRDDLGHRAMAHRQLDPRELAELPGLRFTEPDLADDRTAVARSMVALWGSALLLTLVARRRLRRAW